MIGTFRRGASLEGHMDMDPAPSPPPPVWIGPPPLSDFCTLRWWRQVTPAGSFSSAFGIARLTLVLQGFATGAIATMALFLAAACAASGSQWLPLAAVTLGVAVLSALIAAGMFIASAKLGLRSIKARYLTIACEVLLIAPGFALVLLASYATDHAGAAANPGTDGPFADGGQGLIGLTGLSYAVGAIIVAGILLFAPTVRRGFRR